MGAVPSNITLCFRCFFGTLLYALKQHEKRATQRIRFWLLPTIAVSIVACSADPEVSQRPHSKNKLVADADERIPFSPKELALKARANAVAFETIFDACKKRDFDRFLAEFARSFAVREAYTVTHNSDQFSGQLQRVAVVDPNKFPLQRIDEAWFYAGAGLEPNPLPLVVNVQKTRDNTMKLRWRFIPLEITATWDEQTIQTVKEHGTLEFAVINDCWRLVDDRRSSG